MHIKPLLRSSRAVSVYALRLCRDFFYALLYVNLKVLLRVSMVTETPMDGRIRYMPTYNLWFWAVWLSTANYILNKSMHIYLFNREL